MGFLSYLAWSPPSCEAGYGEGDGVGRFPAVIVLDIVNHHERFARSKPSLMATRLDDGWIMKSGGYSVSMSLFTYPTQRKVLS